MGTAIAAVDNESHISHAVFLDIQLGNVTYYVSSAYAPITIGFNTYTELGNFLTIGQISDDLKTTNGDITITLSGIPSEQNYLNLILNTQIKGGNVVIRRGFFDPETNLPRTGQIYTRFTGLITNFSIDEDNDVLSGQSTITVTLSCAGTNTLLENRICGQRTNPSDRKRFYPGNIDMDRVPLLQNTSFDFGKKYSGGTGYVRPGTTPSFDYRRIGGGS